MPLPARSRIPSSGLTSAVGCETCEDPPPWADVLSASGPMTASEPALLVRPQRQRVVAVLEQDRALVGDATGDLAVRGLVEAVALHRVGQQAETDHRPQDAPGHVVQPRLRDLAGRHGGDQLAVEVRAAGPLVTGLLLVEAVVGGLHGARRGVVVAHDEAAEAVVALEQGVHEVVLTGERAVDLVERAHRGARVALLHAHLEGLVVDLAQRALVDERVDGEAVGLLVVDHPVLEGGDHAGVGLHAQDRLGAHQPVEQRILAEALEGTAPQLGADDVDARGELEVLTGVERLVADRLADQVHQVAIEARRHRGRRRELGRALVDRRVGDPHADRTVGHRLRRNARAAGSRA